METIPDQGCQALACALSRFAFSQFANPGAIWSLWHGPQNRRVAPVCSWKVLFAVLPTCSTVTRKQTKNTVANTSTFHKCAKKIVQIRFLPGHLKPTENLLGILTFPGLISNYLLLFESFLIPSNLSDHATFLRIWNVFYRCAEHLSSKRGHYPYENKCVNSSWSKILYYFPGIKSERIRNLRLFIAIGVRFWKTSYAHGYQRVEPLILL